MSELASELPLFPFVLAEADEDDPVALALREKAPLVRAMTEQGTPAWVALTYEAARQAVTDPRLSRPAAFEPEAPKTTPAQATPQMLPKLDKEDHARVRRLMVKALSPAAQERQRPAIAELVGGLLDGFTGKPLDLLAEFLTPLPVTVICQLYGAPRQDWDLFAEWAEHIQRTTSFTAVEIMESAAELEKYGYDLVKLKRAEPGDDFTTDLIRVGDESGGLSDDEIVQNLLLILVAANDASLKEMAVCFTALLKRPKHYKWLVEHPEAVPTAVEELIRFSRLSRSGLPIRIAQEDVVIGGQHVRQGEGVIPLHHLAHRDPTVFADPDTLDLTRREASRHLGFGGGVHYCTGAPLARVMMQEALGGLVRRFPGLRLAVPWEQLEWQEGGLLRSPKSIPVEW
nr:putative cytochrome P450 hydroxylase [uncultured bacterium]